MVQITFNAFSFLQEKCKANNIGYSEAQMKIAPGTRIESLIEELGFHSDDVEAAMVNGKVVSRSTELADGDRLALIPPGTPGPYRVLLGFYKER